MFMPFTEISENTLREKFDQRMTDCGSTPTSNALLSCRLFWVRQASITKVIVLAHENVNYTEMCDYKSILLALVEFQSAHC